MAMILRPSAVRSLCRSSSKFTFLTQFLARCRRFSVPQRPWIQAATYSHWAAIMCSELSTSGKQHPRYSFLRGRVGRCCVGAGYGHKVPVRSEYLYLLLNCPGFDGSSDDTEGILPWDRRSGLLGVFRTVLVCASGCLLQTQELAFDLVGSAIP